MAASLRARPAGIRALGAGARRLALLLAFALLAQTGLLAAHAASHASAVESTVQRDADSGCPTLAHCALCLAHAQIGHGLVSAAEPPVAAAVPPVPAIAPPGSVSTPSAPRPLARAPPIPA